MKNSFTIPFAIIVGGVIIALAVYLSMPRQANTGNAALMRPLDSTDHIFGNPAAKVIIVEYSDFSCEYCKQFDETLHQVVANLGTNGDVAWVFRNFPLIEIHPNALSQAKAAECVAQVAGNEAYWKFKDLLFANQPANLSRFGEFAASAGAPGEAFAACYANTPAEITDRITGDRKNALEIGAGGTPYSVIITSGKPPVIVEAAYPYDAMKTLVEEALAK